MAAAAAAGALLLLTPLNAWLSRATGDLQLRALAPRQPGTSVVVFDIDDATLTELKPRFGPWPFKRDVYALAIEQLRDLGARAIAFDLLLADSGGGDAALARAIARPGAPVVLAAAGLRHASDGAPHDGSTSAGRAARADDAAVGPPAAGPDAGAPSGGAGATPLAPPAHAWPTIALPTRSVWPAGLPLHLGVITTPLDDDGVLRRLPLWHRDANQRLPVLPWALQQVVDAPGGATPPLDAEGAMHLAMPHREAGPLVLPFSALARVAAGQADVAALREKVNGRVVLIGSSALLADAVMTSQGQMSGTAALAQAYQALHDGTWVRPPARWLDAALVLLALAPALIAVRRGRAAPARDAAAVLLTLLLAAGLVLWALLQWRQPTAWAAPAAVLAATLAMIFFVHQRGQRAARQRLAHELAVAADAARAKSAFLATVSHEMRTPLNALLGVAELLADSPLDARQQRHVQLFHDSGRTLLALIDDLLDLSKMEAGRLQLERAPFSLHDLLEKVIALMQPRAAAKGLRLRLQLAADLPDGVLGDAMRIRQGLVNLLGNAIKFTAHGEVALSATRDARSTDQLRFAVSDTGIGIAPSKFETIFEPFAQADGSVTRLYGGTGLGLAITRRVATLMGGTVELQSRPGVGSTFTLCLPLPEAELPATADAAAAPAPVTKAAPPAAPLQVLLAEDNEVNAYLFSAMLEGQPLEVQVAPNGPSALERLRRRRYDIAFIDLQMPGLDGLAVTRELRRLEAAGGRARTPVVALTANAFASDVQASLEAGCDRHVAKPFTKKQLLDALEQLARPLPSPAGSGNDQPQAGVAAAPAPAGAISGLAGALPERANALQRLGGDTSLYRRVAEHALVFMSGWAPSFEQAIAQGNRSVAHRLAHDLKTIAATVGAAPLATVATALEQSLQGEAQTDEPAEPVSPDLAAHQGVLRALTPVLAVLSSEIGAT